MIASYLRSAIALLKRSLIPSKPKTLHKIRYTVQIPSDGSINASMLSQFTLCLTETPSGKHDIDVELAYGTEDEKDRIRRRLILFIAYLTDEKYAGPMYTVRELLISNDIVKLVQYWLLTTGQSVTFKDVVTLMNYPAVLETDVEISPEAAVIHLDALRCMKQANFL